METFKEGGAVPQQKIKTFTATIENPVKNSAGIAVKNHRRMNVPICHYCGRKGHIRPRCFQYLSDLRKGVARAATGKSRTQHMWVKKDDAQYCVTHNALKATPDHSWNCNSGFSRRMTGKALGKGIVDVTGLLKKKKIEKQTIEVSKMPIDMKSLQTSASVRQRKTITPPQAASEVSHEVLDQVTDQVAAQDATEDSHGYTTVLLADIDE